MDRQAFLNDVQRRIADLVRSSPAADLERNLKAMMSQAFQRLELVTRDEFDVQVELLSRLRARVETLERQLAARDVSSTAGVDSAATFGAPPASATTGAGPASASAGPRGDTA